MDLSTQEARTKGSRRTEAYRQTDAGEESHEVNCMNTMIRIEVGEKLLHRIEIEGFCVWETSLHDGIESAPWLPDPMREWLGFLLRIAAVNNDE